MPPKLADGCWIIPHGGELFFEDGSPIVITEAKIPEQTEYEPIDLMPHGFSVTIHLPHKSQIAVASAMRKVVRMLKRYNNAMRRLIRTEKRLKEKERRMRLKEGHNG